MRDPRERLRDVLEAIAAVERYLARGRAAFNNDELLQSWFVRNPATVAVKAGRDALFLELNQREG